SRRMGVSYPEEKLRGNNPSIAISLFAGATEAQHASNRMASRISTRSGSRTWATKATAQCMFKTIGTMTKGQFQVALDGTDADLKPRGNLVRRLPFDRNAAQDLARPRRQLRERALEGLDLRARLDHSGRIRFIVADIEQRVDLGRTDAIILG